MVRDFLESAFVKGERKVEDILWNVKWKIGWEKDEIKEKFSSFAKYILNPSEEKSKRRSIKERRQKEEYIKSCVNMMDCMEQIEKKDKLRKLLIAEGFSEENARQEFSNLLSKMQLKALESRRRNRTKPITKFEIEAFGGIAIENPFPVSSDYLEKAHQPSNDLEYYIYASIGPVGLEPKDSDTFRIDAVNKLQKTDYLKKLVKQDDLIPPELREVAKKRLEELLKTKNASTRVATEKLSSNDAITLTAESSDASHYINAAYGPKKTSDFLVITDSNEFRISEVNKIEKDIVALKLLSNQEDLDTSVCNAAKERFEKLINNTSTQATIKKPPFVPSM